MTVALLPAFQLPFAGQGQSKMGQVDASTAGDGFAQLLATMLGNGAAGEEMLSPGASRPPAALPQATGHSASQEQGATLELSSPIGSASLAFERGQLLVETACDLPTATTARLTMHPSRGPVEMPGSTSATSDDPGQERAGLANNPEVPSTQWTIGQALPFSPKVTATGATAILSWAPTRASAQQQSIAGPLRAPNMPRASIGTEQAFKSAIANPATPPGTAATSNEPFSARLVAVDGVLRLLLRLPHLDDGERAQIEAGLARVFASFGHRRHDIVIRETGKG